MATSSYGPQLTHCNEVPQSSDMEKETHGAVISELLKKLDHGNKSLYEVELAKAHIESK